MTEQRGAKSGKNQQYIGFSACLFCKEDKQLQRKSNKADTVHNIFHHYLKIQKGVKINIDAAV